MQRTRFTGFTLIEVLVAILVLSFGLLGMLGIIINSLKLSSSSGYRTVAGQQAYAIAETLRANPATMALFSSPASAIQANCMLTAGCPKNDFVSTSFGLWQARLADVLPAGQGNICRDSDPASHLPTVASSSVTWNCDGNGQFVVKICWDEARISASTSAFRPGSSFLCTWTNL